MTLISTHTEQLKLYGNLIQDIRLIAILTRCDNSFLTTVLFLYHVHLFKLFVPKHFVFNLCIEIL